MPGSFGELGGADKYSQMYRVSDVGQRGGIEGLSTGDLYISPLSGKAVA